MNEELELLTGDRTLVGRLTAALWVKNSGIQYQNLPPIIILYENPEPKSHQKLESLDHVIQFLRSVCDCVREKEKTHQEGREDCSSGL